MKPVALCGALAALMLPDGAMAFPDATPWDQDCAQCHTERTLPGAGHLTLRGLPARAAPGAAYQLTVELTHAGMRRAGMRLLALGCGDRTGRFATADGGLETEGAKARTTYDGTTLRSGAASRTWRLEWRAPEDTAGACRLTFDLRANAANDDLSPLGDVIYRVEETVQLKAVR